MKNRGMTLHNKILSERIKLSKKCLTQTNISIEEIANITGFSSRSYFCTVFKRHTGKKPMVYRAGKL